MSLNPICECSDSRFSGNLSEISEESDMPLERTENSSYSSKYHEDPLSLSETFASLNRTSSYVETQLRIVRKSKNTLGIGKNQMVLVQQPHNDKTSQKSLRKYISSVALDILPCLIAAIWAAAILLSMRSPLSGFL